MVLLESSSRNAAVAPTKVAPHSIEAEQAVLGGLMLDNQAWDSVASRLQASDFYRADHRLIFNAMQELELRNSPFDVLTLAESLKAVNQLEKAGGEIYLFELARNTPSAANIIAYAEIVRERSVLRRLINIGHEIAESGFHPNGRTSVELIDEAERKIFAVAEQGIRNSEPQSIQGILPKVLNRVDALSQSDDPITGLSTGFTDLDRETAGLQTSDLIIVAGRPSMGKTAFAMNIAEHAAIKSKQPVLIFSMEMPADALVMRMFSSLGRIDQHRLRTGRLTDEDWPRITTTVTMLSEAKIYIDDTPALNPAEVRARARRLTKEHGQLGLIILDYLQLMQLPGTYENRALEISTISRSLKALAKELNVPIIALSQLNRSLEQRGDKRPMMSDLRESGAIEQDADLILFIYRDEVYHPDSKDKGTAEIIIAKQRNGPIGKIRLTFLGNYTRFENFSTSQYTEY